MDRRTSLLTLGLISAALSTAAAAAPIEYRFSWEASATLVKSLSNVSAEMRIPGNTANVVVGSDFAANIGPFGAGLTGEFSALSLTRQESGLTVTRDSIGPFDFLTFSKNNSPTPLYEVGLNATDVPGIQAYDLKTALGPVSGPRVYSGGLTLDFGADGVLSFSSINGTVGFEAATGTGGAISYDFSWNGDATLTTQLANASYQMTFWADTSDVISGAFFDTEYAINGRTVTGGLTGEFSGAGLHGLFPGLEVAREGLLGSNPRQDILKFNYLGDPSIEAGLLAAGQPGIETYDLRSAYGPVTGPGFFLMPPLDFGADGRLSFSSIRSMTFEAIETQQAPEPGILHLTIISLLGLAIFRRRTRPRV